MSDLTGKRIPKQTLHGSISTSSSSNPLRGNVMTRGLDGKSAYEYAVSKGYEGTEEEFAAKLKELADSEQGVSSWNDLEDKPFYEDEEGNIHYLDEKFIPDTIARKEDIPEQVQSDYGEHDKTLPSFVKNKTHFEYAVVSSGSYTVDFTGEEILEKEYVSSSIRRSYKLCEVEDYHIIAPVTITVEYDGATYVGEMGAYDESKQIRTVRIQDSNRLIGMFYIVYGESSTIYNMSLTKGLWIIYPSSEYWTKTTRVIIKANKVDITLKQLDEKFIPNSIARKSDIPEQSDALYLISELGLAGGEIIADDNGNVFTDENGVIYVI